jgi:hypothetical protein
MALGTPGTDDLSSYPEVLYRLYSFKNLISQEMHVCRIIVRRIL